MATSQNPNPSRDEPQMESGEERRDWAELGGDILLVVFGMVGIFDVLMSAELVCRSWRKAAKDEPELWRRIDMTECDNWYEFKKLTLAIDRSRGRLEELWISAFGDHYLLRYACDRAHVLKSLRLIECSKIYTSNVVEAVRKQPLLEELEITLGNFNDGYLVSVGEALPNLKQFRLNRTWSNMRSCCSEDEESKNMIAFGIAKTMQQLRHLQLVGNILTNKGLTAILEGCQHLESLDIRMCNNVKMDSDMRTRCTKLTTFRPPDDPLDDYPYQAEPRYDFDSEEEMLSDYIDDFDSEEEMLDDYIDTDDLVYDYDYHWSGDGLDQSYNDDYV